MLKHLSQAHRNVYDEWGELPMFSFNKKSKLRPYSSASASGVIFGRRRVAGWSDLSTALG